MIRKDGSKQLSPKYGDIRIRPRSVESIQVPEKESDKVNVVGRRIKRYRNKVEKFRNSLK